MTKPMDPEVKAMRAINRALLTMPPEGQVRVIDYFHARAYGTSQATVRRALNLVGLSSVDSKSQSATSSADVGSSSVDRTPE